MYDYITLRQIFAVSEQEKTRPKEQLQATW